MKSAEISSSIWLIGEKLFSMSINLVVMLMIARNLGPDVFGELNYLLAIIALLAPITALGLNSLITKEVLKREDSLNVILGSSLTIRFIGGIFGFLLILLLMYFFDIAHGKNIELALLAFANIFTAAYVFDFYMQAKILNKSVVKLRLSVFIFINLIKIVGLYYNAHLQFYIVVSALELFLTSLGFSILFQLKTTRLRQLKTSTSEAKYLLKQSGWLILSGVAGVIYLKSDQFMLGLLSTNSQVGIYAVASRLSEVWYFIPSAIVISFFPKLIHIRGTPLYKIELQKLNDLLFFIAILVAIPTTLLAKPAIILLFGEAYQDAGIILSIHIWAGLFIFMRTLLSKWLINENLLKFALITQGAGAIMNVGFNFWLIPIYGGIGAAIATVISYASASYFALFFHRKTLPMAKIMTNSFLLPLRLIIYRQLLYKIQK